MKSTSLIALLLMSLAFVSCGNDNSSSKNGVYGSGYGAGGTTQIGYYDLNSQVIQVGQQTIPPSQQYSMIVNQALQNAQLRNVRPVMINGVQKLRARVTFQNPYSNGYGTGYNSGYNTGYNTGYQQMIMTAVQFY
jgi:opacity protein-like surface antigen